MAKRPALRARAVAAVAAGAVILGAVATPAISHSWYDKECCTVRDCAPLRDGDVVRTADGWYVLSMDVTVPFGDYRIRPSRDDHFHGCVLASGWLHCLYVPYTGL